MLWPAITSRIGRRLTGVMIAVAVLPVLLLTGAGIRQALDGRARLSETRLEAECRAYASQVASRMVAAELLARTLTGADAGTGGAALHTAVARFPVFVGAAVLAPETVLPGGSAGIDPVQQIALRAGQTVVRTVPGAGGRRSVYLVRAARADGTDQLAFLEVAPDWLWPENVRGSGLAVVDESGAALFGASELADAVLPMLAARARRDAPAAGIEPVSWQEAGREWHGALARLALPHEFAASPRWAVAAFAPQPSLTATLSAIWPAPALAASLALLAALCAAAYLAGRYVPALREMQERLRLMGDRRFETRALRAPDEVGEAAQALVTTARSLDDEFRAIETIAEIDRLLLGAFALEQVVDAMLPRVLAVSGGDSVGVVLLDTDAPVHARVYTTSRHRSELPVARVTLDPDMIGTLHAAPNGLTVARCEEGRHSFLEPLRELGSEFFWIWPVHSGSRMLAALCVGFDETPAPAPRLAVRGGQFAARLAIAVANSEREEQLYRQAHFDVLTGLPNRLLFRDRLAQELATATAGLSRGALLYVDLDHFKKVNDTVGHGAGDQLLVIVAQRLRSCVKEGDTVSRLGGDEFTIILRNVSDPDGARTVADRVIESVQLPVNIAGRDHFVHASVGITLFPDDGAEIDTLMRNADLAMYRAKEAGRGRALFFDPRMTEVVAAVADSGLHRALKRREFTLFYQPQFAIADGHLAGVEALLRWHTPRDGMRHPHEFVPAAEASGLIVDIGAWVLEAACAQFSAWREQGIAPPRMAINVSAKQLQYMDFPRNVQRMLDKHGIPADMLELELTESVFADHVSRQTLAKLAELGVRLALDDFGTGYSSLNYLRQFPIHMVKIDRSFLEDVPENQTSATLAETIILMAHAFGKTVVGEGVETSAQLDFLRERGCDVAQGFYLSRPLTASAATELFGNGRSHRDEPSSERAAG